MTKEPKMTGSKWLLTGLGAAALSTVATGSWAQETVVTVLEDITPSVAMDLDALSAMAAYSGDTAWMLTSTMLVILMIVPGVALFYGGIGSSKNMLSVLIQVFASFSLVSLLWAIYGYSLAFGASGAVFGDLSKAFLLGITPDSMTEGKTFPEFVFVAFQLSFAGITCTLIVGAFAERMKFSAVMIFMAVWYTICYVPIAHIVWGPGGFLAKDGAMDYAGGSVVHINAGVAGLVGAYLVGKRIGFGREALAPHSVTLTMVGASLLWIGWFGFNAGSATAANGEAGLAFINTILATAAGALSWLAVEAALRGKASMLGAASGCVGGLVAITPAAGFVGPMGAIIMGLIAGPAGFWGVNMLKRWLHVDDAFDVFGVHGVCGIMGAILTGVFAAPVLGGYPLNPESYTLGGQLAIQFKGVLVTMVWSAVAALIACGVARLLVGLRVSEEAERSGLDLALHGEVAYRD